MLIEGFMRFKDKVEIEFPSNQVTLISGENGSGKTSVLDAICLCLYGKTFRTSGRSISGYVMMSDLVNHDSNKAIIQLEFENHGHNYLVTREISARSSGGELLEDGVTKAVKSAVYDYVRNFAVGLDWEGFRKSSIVLQGEMSSLTELGPSERKKAFMKLFGLERYMLYDQLAKNKMDAKAIAIEKIEEIDKVWISETKKIPEIEEAIKKFKANIENLEKERNILATELVEKKKVKESLEGDYNRYTLLKERIENFSREIAKLKKAIAQREKQLLKLNNLKKQLPGLRKSYGELVSIEDGIRKLKPLKTRFDTLSKDLSILNASVLAKEDELNLVLKNIKASRLEIKKLKKEIPSESIVKKVGKQLEQSNSKRVELEKTKASLVAIIKRINNSIKDLKGKLKALKGEDTCPVCLQKIIDPAEIIKHYNGEIRKLVAEKTEKRKHLNNVTTELATLSKLINEVKKKEEDLENKLNKKIACEREKKALLQQQRRKVALGDEVKGLRKKRSERENAIVALRFDPSKYEKMDTRMSVLRKKKIAEKYTNAATQLNKWPQVKKEIREAEAESIRLNKKKAGLEQETASLGDIEKKYVKVKGDLESTQTRLGNKDVTIATEKTNLDNNLKLLEELREREQKIKEDEKKIEELREETIILETLRNVFKNIPENILRRLRPFIEKEGTDIINDLSNNEINTINIEEETLNVSATMFGQVRPIHYFSEGQKTRINMALRVAISRILSKLPQTEEHIFAVMQTLFIDEGDFGNLDESGIHEAIDVIRNLTKEFDRVILISHVDAIKEIFHGYTINVVKTELEESTIETSNMEYIAPETAVI